MNRLLIGLLLCGILLATGCAAAQSSNLTSLIQPIGQTPELIFNLPSETDLSTQANKALNYDGGWDLSTTLQLKSGDIQVHLLYPSASIMAGLSQEEIKSQLEDFRPEMKSARYDAVPQSVNDHITVSGELSDQDGTRTFIAYQPGMSTIAIIFFDLGVAPEIKSAFLKSFHIQTNEEAILSSNEPATNESAANTSAQASASPAVMAQAAPETSGGSDASQAMIHVDQVLKDKGPGAEARAERLGVAMERMGADREAASERLGQARENLGP
jgi:hypothetical protein